MSDVDDLVEWLRAQLDEDERLVHLQPPWPWRLNAERDEVRAADDELVADVYALSGHQQRNTAEHIARQDPAHVLNLVAAHRRILDQCAEWLSIRPVADWEVDRLGDAALIEAGEKALRALAAGYRERPGYREEWRPA